MSLTVNQANQLLGQITTEAELRNLIAQLDVSGGGGVTILYGGKISANLHSMDLVAELLATSQDIRVLDNTEASRFLDFRSNLVFQEALTFPPKPKP